MILPLLGKALLGAGKRAAMGVKGKAKKIAVDKFMNKKKEQEKIFTK